MFIAHLHQRLRLYTIRWMNLNVIVYPHVMYLVRNVQLRLFQKSSIKSTILFWLIDEWKCASLLKAYYMACDFNFARTLMKKLSARWVLRLLTVNHKRDVWRFQNNVWRCFNVIQMNFCVDSLLWTKHGSITLYPRRRNSQNNGLHRVNQFRRRRRPWSRPERWWP